MAHGVSVRFSPYAQVANMRTAEQIRGFIDPWGIELKHPETRRTLLLSRGSRVRFAAGAPSVSKGRVTDLTFSSEGLPYPEQCSTLHPLHGELIVIAAA